MLHVAGAPANQVEQGRPVVPRTSGAPSAAPEAGARVAWARRLAALGEVCGVYALGLLLASLLFAALAWGYLYYRSGSLLVPIIAHALVNVPMGTSAAVGLVVLLLGVVVLAREPIKGALRTSWGLFSSAALPRRATALGGLALVLFAVLLAAMQDVALLLGLALLVVALVAETLEKRRQTSTRWALAVTRSTSAHMDSAAGPLVSGLLFDSASVALSCWVMIGLFLDGWAHEHQPSWPAWRACCSAPSRCRRGLGPGDRVRRAAATHAATAQAEVALPSAPGQRRGQGARLVAFFALAFGLSWAAWLPTTLASRELLGWELPPDLSRPVGAFGPTLAALPLTAACSGRRGLGALLARLAIWRVGIGWYAFALLWPAAHSLATTGVHVLLGAAPPDFAHPPVLWLYPAPPELFAAGPWPLLPFVFVQTLLLSSPMGEEPGWRGFALPRLQARFGALGASLVLGVLWGLWHPPLTLTSGDPSAGTFSGWYLLGITGEAVLYTWLFNSTGGSLLLVLLLHAAMSITGLFLAATDGNAVIGVALTWLAVLAILLRARRRGDEWAWFPSGRTAQ